MSETRGLLRIIDGRPFHWCPACERLHALPSDTGRWSFDGNYEQPTFSPSFRHSFGQGRQCHYTLTAGMLNYHNDCTHALADHQVPLPPIPEGAE